MGRSRHPLILLAASFALLAVLLSGIGARASAATVIPVGAPRMPRTQVACYDRKSHRYYPRVEPWHCVFAGRVIYVGNIEIEEFPAPPGRGTFATFPIEGEWERIEWWDRWGGSANTGSQAIDERNGDEVEVVVSRRVRCADGSLWYSMAEVIDEADVFGIRLPVCKVVR
jgi:hypothetical protein